MLFCFGIFFFVILIGWLSFSEFFFWGGGGFVCFLREKEHLVGQALKLGGPGRSLGKERV